MAISYIICAAGRGTRTKAIHQNVPKPLLKLHGLTLLERSLRSLQIHQDDQLIIIHSKEVLAQEVSEGLGDFQSHQKLLLLSTSLTRGQLDTAALAFPFVPAGNSVAIFNSDTFFSCRDLEPSMKASNFDGLIPCSREPGDNWSFCRLKNEADAEKIIHAVTEKQRISEWCSVGFYWFKNIELLKKYADLEIQSRGPSEEIYVAPMYNALIRDGYRIKMLSCEEFKPMGSMDQISNYWGVTLEEMIRENQQTRMISGG